MTVILFADRSARTQALIRSLSDLALEPLLGQCSYAKVEWAKDSQEAKDLKVAAGGTLLILDPREEPAKVIKTFTAVAPATLLKELKDGIKKMEKK